MAGEMIERLEQRQLLSVAPGGPAFEIGTNYSNRSSVAADADGDLVVAWTPPGGGVLVQRLAPNGTPIDSTPNVVSSGPDDFARVAVNAAGSFVVTWDQEVPLRNGYDWQVHARAFNAATGTFGGDMLVQSADLMVHCPAVAIDADAQFVVAWRDNGGGRYSSLNTYARLYSASGAALGKQFQVTTSGATVVDPRVAMDSAGDFVIAWHDTGLGEAFARRYNASGVAAGGQFAVGSDTSGAYNSISVTMDSSGDALIAWSTSGLVYAQRYTSSGAAQWATPLELGGDGTGATSFVYASMDGAGNAVVAWQQKDPIQNFDLYEQQFDSSGNALGGVVNITPYDSSTGRSDAWALEGIAAQPNGDFAFTWIDTSANTTGLWGRQYVQQ